MSSVSGNAVISKNVTLDKATSGVAGSLTLAGDYLVCGTIGNSSMLNFSSGEVVEIDSNKYESMLTSSILTFDPNGGSVDTTEQIIYYGQYYGEMPTPVKTGYTFVGWFTEATGGTQITSDTVVTVLANQTLYAQWSAMAYTANWNIGTGYTITVKRTSSPYANAATGTLSSGATVYYGDVLDVTYTASTGYTINSKGSTAITVTGNVTASNINATVSVNSYKVSWNTGTGCTITVKRTSSPLQGASTGNLTSGSTIYYGDVLSISYAANTGYTLASKGSTAVTVTGNVTSSTIYASASVNSYKVSWNTGTGYTITVKRTSSPLQGASTGTVSNGATIYYGDILSATYTATTGYSLSTKGSTSITVTGNVTSSTIYATATANSYTYNIVYQSTNGTALGSTTATYKYGTTNTISAPAKSGYNTPSSQSITWDSTSAKTITFKYTPTSVSTQTVKTGTWVSWGSGKHGITYNVKVEFGERTSTGVKMRVVWTNTVFTSSYMYYGYAQNYSAAIGGTSTGSVQIAAASAFNSATYNGATATGTSGWITVPVSATSTSTSISLSWADGDGISGSWSGTVTVPTY